MALDKEKLIEYSKRLLLSRMRILADQSFFGVLLSHISFAIDEKCETAATDAHKIFFGPSFLESLSDAELDFVLIHEILHVALQHCFRDNGRESYLFNVACDIVVNSNIMKSLPKTKALKILGDTPMHIAPDGKEGYNYTAEEVYDMLLNKSKKSGGSSGSGSGNGQSNQGGSSSANNSSSSSQTSKDGGGSSKSDSAKSKQGKSGKGQGSSSKQGEDGQGENTKTGCYGTIIDDHSKWDYSGETPAELVDSWARCFEDAVQLISVEDPSNMRGTMPAFAERILKERKDGQLDWRHILHEFIQEEINDYSFSPPDRRFSDSDFFLPDYNATEETIMNVLFMVDTSGSMSDKMIAQCYDEIHSAITQFDGKLAGHLGFFDAVVVEPLPFSSISELEIIRPYGGGGTRFDIIFEYVKKKMNEPFPVSIIILTDGYAPFPKEEVSLDIPVLWVINNNEVTPPWGKIARIKA